MKRKISKLLLGSTFLFLLSILNATARPIIQEFKVRPHYQGALVYNETGPTPFTGDYVIYFTAGADNTVYVDIMYRANDLSEEIVLSSVQTHYGELAPQRTVEASLNATLPSGKKNGSLYLRVRSTTNPNPALILYSNPVAIYYEKTPPVIPPATIEEKIRRSVEPKGKSSHLLHIRESVREAIPFYLTYTVTSSSGDGYFDLSSNGVSDDNVKVIRKEFYAYDYQHSGSIPVYKFAEKANPQKFIFTTIRQQDENIWQFIGMVFYAFDAESFRNTGTRLGIAPLTTPVYQIHKKNAPGETFYGIISPSVIGGAWRQPSAVNAAFLAYPAFITSNGDLLDGVFQIEVRSTQKVLDVRGSSKADGAIIQQSTWDGGLAQRWLLTRLDEGDGTLFKITSVNSGKAVTVATSPSNIQQGNNVVQNPWTGASTQKWQVYLADGKYMTIRLYNQGLMLNVEGDANWDGAPVIIWPETAKPNEQWALYRM